MTAPTDGPTFCRPATVADLRRSLTRQHAAHSEQAEVYTKLVMALPKDAPDTPESTAVRAAWLGHSMAANYSYTLAAALGLAEKRLGREAARDLAFEVGEIMSNGDYDGWNTDVTEPDSTPDEETP